MHTIIPAVELRPYLIKAVERGMERAGGKVTVQSDRSRAARPTDPRSGGARPCRLGKRGEWVIDDHHGFRAMASRLDTARLILEPFDTMDAESYAELVSERGPGGRGFGTTVDQARHNIAQIGQGSAGHRHRPDGRPSPG